MKKYIITLIAAIFALGSSAQSIAESKLNGKIYVEVSMECDGASLNNINIMLDKKTADKFIRNLRKVQSKVKKCVQTAETKHLKNYRKTLEGSYSYSKMQFGNADGTNVADSNYNNYLVPYFNVDAEGNSCLVLGGYYSGYNNSNMGSDYDKRTEFFYYLSIPVNELDSWINKLEVAANEAESKQQDFNAVNDLFMAIE